MDVIGNDFHPEIHRGPNHHASVAWDLDCFLIDERQDVGLTSKSWTSRLNPGQGAILLGR